MDQRANIYGFPHKGIRKGLGELSFKIGSLILDDDQELNSCQQLLIDITNLLDLHLNLEENYINPPIEEKVRGSTQHNVEDHIEMHRLEHEMKTAVEQLVKDPNPMKVGLAYGKTNHFIKEYYRHMEEEETGMNKVIWEHFSDEEVLGWQGKILSSMTSDELFLLLKFVVPALSPFEQSLLLGGFKKNTPAEAYSNTIKKLETYLSSKQMQHIKSL